MAFTAPAWRLLFWAGIASMGIEPASACQISVETALRPGFVTPPSNPDGDAVAMAGLNGAHYIEVVYGWPGADGLTPIGEGPIAVEKFADGAWRPARSGYASTLQPGTKVRLFGTYVSDPGRSVGLSYLLGRVGPCGGYVSMEIVGALPVRTNDVVVEGVIVRALPSVIGKGYVALPVSLVQARLVAQGPPALRQLVLARRRPASATSLKGTPR